MVIALFISLVYSRILSLFQGMNLIDILEHVFGKFFGKTISILFVWYAFHVSAWVGKDLADYETKTSLPETPQVILIFFMTRLCV